MSTFQTSFDSTVAKANESISSLSTYLRTEKEALEKVLTNIKAYYSELNSSITSKIEKLQDDLATESKIMDALALKTEKVKVLTIKLDHAKKKINEHLSEKIVIKSCIAYVNALLSHIIETRDSMIMMTIKKHLAEKLHPVFATLNRLEGVSDLSSIPKQGETLKKSKKEIPKPTAKPKSENEPKDNVPSDSKGKEKL
ncbi:unnamed protein product [Lactuca saligna]|uniref:Uncharacterized protein n=1 Tax=Lactuca saligna TaxID=75948 RepID=A0AA35V3P6_LACSI|nr:unnamed protein product [Lactuca saligna]